MAKKSHIAREVKRAKLVKQFAEKRDELRTKQSDVKLSIDERIAAGIALNKLPRDSSKSRIRNRCKITGRPRGGYRKFGISRIKFREFASFGLIPGVTKASW